MAKEKKKKINQQSKELDSLLGKRKTKKQFGNPKRTLDCYGVIPNEKGKVSFIKPTFNLPYSTTEHW